jgi:hypothetical protein
LNKTQEQLEASLQEKTRELEEIRVRLLKAAQYENFYLSSIANLSSLFN